MKTKRSTENIILVWCTKKLIIDGMQYALSTTLRPKTPPKSTTSINVSTF